MLLGAMLVGVIGGKLSEGINFEDELGRMVIVLGLPFPNPNDLEVQERIKFNSLNSNSSINLFLSFLYRFKYLSTE